MLFFYIICAAITVFSIFAILFSFHLLAVMKADKVAQDARIAALKAQHAADMAR